MLLDKRDGVASIENSAWLQSGEIKDDADTVTTISMDKRWIVVWVAMAEQTPV